MAWNSQGSGNGASAGRAKPFIESSRARSGGPGRGSGSGSARVALVIARDIDALD